MAASLFGLYFGDGTSAAMLGERPRGDTTGADARELQTVQISERFLFGGMGGRQAAGGGIEFGYWFPGTQGRLVGEPLPQAGSMPAGRGRPVRLRRYHPIRAGLVQEYELAIRFGRRERFHDFSKKRLALELEDTQVGGALPDMEVVRRSLIDMLAGQVETHGDRPACPMRSTWRSSRAPEAAVFLIMDAERGRSPLDEVSVRFQSVSVRNFA